MLAVCSLDIPIFGQMTRDIATCMYLAGIGPFAKKPVQASTPARPEAAARPDAVLQAGELFRRAAGAH